MLVKLGERNQIRHVIHIYIAKKPVNLGLGVLSINETTATVKLGLELLSINKITVV
jgi:hypothetical protein